MKNEFVGHRKWIHSLYPNNSNSMKLQVPYASPLNIPQPSALFLCWSTFRLWIFTHSIPRKQRTPKGLLISRVWRSHVERIKKFSFTNSGRGTFWLLSLSSVDSIAPGFRIESRFPSRDRKNDKKHKGEREITMFVNIFLVVAQWGIPRFLACQMYT